MKCRCGDVGCKTVIRFDTYSHTILVEAFNKPDILIHLDANGCVELISGLRDVLNHMVGPQDT